MRAGHLGFLELPELYGRPHFLRLPRPVTCALHPNIALEPHLEDAALAISRSPEPPFFLR